MEPFFALGSLREVSHAAQKKQEVSMIRKTLVVNEEHGIHARPASIISKACRNLDSKVIFTKDSKQADGRSVLQMMLLAAEQGAMIEVIVEGGDEFGAMNRITELFEHGSAI